MAQPTFEVQLAVYDLSRGMARSLSTQFLGPAHAIDIIPHTGVVVFGQEYFYGGGIQSADPAAFRQSMQIFPIEVQNLGHTNRTKEEFEQWCAASMRNGQWDAQAYDLLTKNCNNFCQAAVEFLGAPRGVPEWVLDVPQRFLSSPMGQMIRPMLENMQMTGGAGGASAPFANASVATPAAASSSDSSNPWASMPGRTESSNLSSADVASDREVAKSSSSPAKPVSTPVLDAHSRPMLSSDAKAANVCVNKLTKVADYDSSDKSTLESLARDLMTGKKPSHDIVEESSGAILRQLNAADNVVFALMLMRLVVLYPPQSVSEASSFGKCIEWIESHLADGDSSDLLLSAPARSMAWCTLSNAYGTSTSSIPSLQHAVEVAMMDLSPEAQPRVEVRQSAATFLYNAALAQSHLAELKSEALPDVVVSLLCGSLEGIVDEPDATTRLRRLLVAGKIVKPDASNPGVHDAAKILVADLGFTEAISMLSAGNGKGRDGEKAQKLAGELHSLIEN